jgi:hypothetical protein
MTALYQLVGQLRELEGLADSEDFPVEALQDTLEGLTGEIEIKAQNVAQFILNLEASAEAIALATANMERRRALILKRTESVRQYLYGNMQASGITKISCPFFTLTIKKNPPKVVITDPGKIPCELYVYPPAPEPYPDKKAISAKLKAGETIDGVHLEQGERLEIKT